eukprot:5575846-Alexandrium_andersonii.AAC.1
MGCRNTEHGNINLSANRLVVGRAFMNASVEASIRTETSHAGLSGSLWSALELPRTPPERSGALA